MRLKHHIVRYISVNKIQLKGVLEYFSRVTSTRLKKYTADRPKHADSIDPIPPKIKGRFLDFGYGTRCMDVICDSADVISQNGRELFVDTGKCPLVNYYHCTRKIWHKVGVEVFTYYNNI